MKTWTVNDVMTTPVVTAAASTPYRDVVDLLMGNKVSAIPVVDDFRRISGVISEADLLCKIELAEQVRGPRIFQGRRQRAIHTRAAARTAGELMTCPAVVVLSGTSIVAAARLMDDKNVKHLPVTDDLGRLIGIVSRSDLLKVHLRPDSEIQDDVVTDVLRRTLGLKTGTVDVRVNRGVVVLTGHVERRSFADIATRLTRQIAGVVTVVDELRYDVDDGEFAGTGLPFGVA